MFTHPHVVCQLAREHQRQMLADAAQRQLLHRHHLAAASMPGIATGITRRLAALIARAGAVISSAPGAAWDRGGADVR
jgi:hypothetical protein